MTAKKPGLLSKLMDQVYEPVAVAPSAASQSTVVKPNYGGSSAPAFTPASHAPSVDPALVEEIRGRVAAETHEAYGQLMSLLQELASVIPDEETRLKAALVSMGKLGFNAQAVLTIYENRVQFINKFRDEFDTAARAKLDAAVSQSDREVESIDAENARLEQQIKDLTTKLTERRQRRIEVLNERQNKVTTLEKNSADTRNAIAVVEMEVVAERDTASRLLA